MESKAPIKINGEEYLLFASQNVKRLLIKNKIAAIDIAQEFVNRPFTKIGTSNIKKIGDNNVSVLNIKATDFETNKEVKCFVMHCVGNYTEMLPVYKNKWSVTLECGHKAIIDESVDYICKNHVVPCFKCENKKGNN